jgi:RNA polymerase sigma-70 factor (ECF subfamily)
MADAADGASAGDARLDAALLARAARGEAGAARLLAARHAPALLASARRMLNDPAEAEDVAQEAFLRLWRAAPDWPASGGGAPVAAWLRRVAINLCLDRLRRRGRWAALDEAAEPPDPAPSALDRLAAANRAEALAAALAALPDRQRAAVTLRHVEELGNPEIAAALGVSVEAVESLLARGRRRLAAALRAHRADAA